MLNINNRNLTSASQPPANSLSSQGTPRPKQRVEVSHHKHIFL